MGLTRSWRKGRFACMVLALGLPSQLLVNDAVVLLGRYGHFRPMQASDRNERWCDDAPRSVPCYS